MSGKSKGNVKLVNEDDLHVFRRATEGLKIAKEGGEEGLSVKVLGYEKFSGEIKACDNHAWNLSVMVDGQTYTLVRTYLEFVYLDSALRKRFSDDLGADLPFVGAAKLSQTLNAAVKKEVAASPRKGDDGSSGSAGDSPTKNFGRRGSVKGAGGKLFLDSNEPLDGHEHALETYMCKLLSKSHLMGAPELLDFLEPDAVLQGKLNIYASLFVGVDLKVTTVARNETISVPLKQGEHAVWNFSTVDYDIGFDLKVNGESLLPCMRVNSHLEDVSGSYRASGVSTILDITFDNSHSKLRSKKLTYQVSVASDDDIEACEAAALGLQLRQKRVEQTRALLKTRMAARGVAMSRGLSLMRATPMERSVGHDERTIAALEREVAALRDANAKVDAALHASMMEHKAATAWGDQLASEKLVLADEFTAFKDKSASDYLALEQKASADFTAFKEKSESDFATYKAEVEREARENADAHGAELAKSQSETAATEEQRSALEIETTNLRRDLAATQDECGNLQTQLSMVRADLEKEQSALTRLKALTAEAANTMPALEEAISRVKSKLTKAASV